MKMHKNNTLKRGLALLLAVLMCTSMLMVSALAAGKTDNTADAPTAYIHSGANEAKAAPFEGEIPDGNAPLTDAPQAGGNIPVMMGLMLVSGGGLAAILLCNVRKKTNK